MTCDVNHKKVFKDSDAISGGEEHGTEGKGLEFYYQPQLSVPERCIHLSSPSFKINSGIKFLLLNFILWSKVSKSLTSSGTSISVSSNKE